MRQAIKYDTRRTEMSSGSDRNNDEWQEKTTHRTTQSFAWITFRFNTDACI